MSVSTAEIERNLSIKKRVENFLDNYEKIIELIRKALEKKDLAQLRTITAECFNLGREAGLRLFIGRVKDISPAFQKGDLAKIGKFLKNELPTLKEFLERKVASLPAEVAPAPRPPYWGYEKGTPAKTSVYVLHGGGLQYILGWLKGKEGGYKLEQPGKGIQVIPFLQKPSSVSETTCYYATDRSAQSLDYPAYLCAEIEVQYLDSADGNGGDGEAGVRTELRQHLKNIEVEPVLSSNPFIAKIEFETIPKDILFEAFKVKGSLNFLNERERRGDKVPLEITHFFKAFKNATNYKKLEEVVSIIKDYVPEEVDTTFLQRK